MRAFAREGPGQPPIGREIRPEPQPASCPGTEYVGSSGRWAYDENAGRERPGPSSPTGVSSHDAKGNNRMLVLSRKPGERIHIGQGIVMTVVRVDGQQVRVGIEAPRDVSIVREELVDQVPPGARPEG